MIYLSDSTFVKWFRFGDLIGHTLSRGQDKSFKFTVQPLLHREFSKLLRKLFLPISLELNKTNRHFLEIIMNDMLYNTLVECHLFP